MKPDNQTIKPMTAGKLAKTLQRSEWGIRRALARLAVEPKIELDGIKYYSAETLALLTKEMRSRNATH